jgi:hypothetical protein
MLARLVKYAGLLHVDRERVNEYFPRRGVAFHAGTQVVTIICDCNALGLHPQRETE